MGKMHITILLWVIPTFIDGVSSHKVTYVWIEMCFAALELHSAMPVAWIVPGLATECNG